MKYIEIPEQQISLYPLKKPVKSILDIGGGGSGVISKAYTNQNVIAIDKKKSELIEAGSKSIGIVMDASNMGFIDNSFQYATSFFTMMYLTKEEKFKVLTEVYRVLDDNGEFIIWDSEISLNNDDTFGDVIIIHLKVTLPNGSSITPSYGVSYSKPFENSLDLLDMLTREVGFQLIEIC